MENSGGVVITCQSGSLDVGLMLGEEACFVVAIFVNDLSNLLQLAMSNRNRGVRKK